MLENIDISLVKCGFDVNTSILFALDGGCWRPAGGLLAFCWRWLAAAGGLLALAGAGWRLPGGLADLKNQISGLSSEVAFRY